MIFIRVDLRQARKRYSGDYLRAFDSILSRMKKDFEEFLNNRKPPVELFYYFEYKEEGKVDLKSILVDLNRFKNGGSIEDFIENFIESNFNQGRRIYG